MFKQAIVFGYLALVCSAASAQDWAYLKRYQRQNDSLSSLPVPRDRVVFMGNSITDFWINRSPQFFADHHYVDRGISGQTSPQMLLRFTQDVVDLQPQAVVIECGTNDIAGNTGPSTLKMITDNISAMAEIAKAHNILVIIVSVLPASRFIWRPDAQPAAGVDSLNKWLRGYAAEKHFAYVDYYSALVDGEGGMKKEYSADGVHPNDAGYKVMEAVVQPVIMKVLGKP